MRATAADVGRRGHGSRSRRHEVIHQAAAPLIYVARALQDREGERGTAIINIIIRLNFQLKLQISTRIQVLKGKNVTTT